MAQVESAASVATVWGTPQRAAEFEASWPTMSRHLAVLKDADLITAERQGNQILYRVNT